MVVRAGSVTSILAFATMLLNWATVTVPSASTDLERSRIEFESRPLKKLGTPFVNFASAGNSTRARQKSDVILREKVTFDSKDSKSAQV